MRNKNNKTDKVKRMELEQRLRKEYPNETPEQIWQRREDYLRENYGAGEIQVKPQPETRQHEPQVLTLARIADEAERDKHFFEGTGGCLIGFLPAPALLGVFGLCTGHYDDYRVWICIAVSVLMLFLGIHGFRSDYSEKGEQKKLLTTGNLRMVRYTVADMELEDTGSETRCMEYRLHLTGSSMETPWVCECTRFQYETTREGDTVYVVYPGDSQKHCYLFSEAAWIPDEAVRKLMKQAKDA